MAPAGRVVVITLGGARRVTIAPPPLVPLPPATQLAGPRQFTATRSETPAGAVCGFHAAPPSAVWRMFVPPTAVQMVALLQETDDSAVEPSGSPRLFHWA